MPRILSILICFLLFASFAEARKITIVQAKRLELRNVTNPDGQIEEYIVITGSPAVVKVDEDEITADRLEYNKTSRKMRIVGFGVFKSKDDNIAGRDFEVDIESQGLQAEDVIIATKEIDIQGVNCSRLPGQLEVTNGYFSPCTRCGETEDAYGFRAGNITLYPGDRLIARDVTVVVAGQPVMYLPIMVIFLNEPSRRPRVELNIGETANSSRPTVALDLPFTISDFGFGFWYLRYFAGRNPAFGFGADTTLYDILGQGSRVRLYFMALPPSDSTGNAISNRGVQLGYRIDAFGDIPLATGDEAEDRLPSIRYSFSLGRVDSDISSSGDGPKSFNAENGLQLAPGLDKQTNFSINTSWEASTYNISTNQFRSPLFKLELIANGVIDHRQVRTGDTRAGAQVIQYLPELRFVAGQGLVSSPSSSLPNLTPFSINSWGFTVGYITAPVDRLNNSANKQAGASGIISALRFTINWGLGFAQPLWDGANLRADASFRGQYYTTRNPGTDDPNTFNGQLERNINFSTNTTFTQSIAGNFANFTLGAGYSVSQGESPFSFDRVPTRPGSGRISATLSLRPLDWINASFSETYNFSQTPTGNRLEPFTASLNLTPRPLNISVTGSYDLERGKPLSYSLNFGNSANSGTTFSVGFGYRFNELNGTVLTSRNQFDRPLDLRIGYSTPGRDFSITLTISQNLNTGEIYSWLLKGLNVLGDTANPWRVDWQQRLTPPQYTNEATPQPFAKLVGNTSINHTLPVGGVNERQLFTNLSLTLDNVLDFKPFEYSTTTMTPPSSFGISANLAGNINDGGLSIGATFRSQFDLAPFELYNPNLTFNFIAGKGEALDVNLGLGIRFADRTQPFPLWNFSVQFGWDLFPGVSIYGDVKYSRGFNNGFFSDSFAFNPFGITFAFADVGETKPSVFISMTLKGTYSFSDNPSQIGKNPTFTSGTDSYTAVFRPVFTVVFDECCYSVILVFDLTPKDGRISLSLSLPYGSAEIVRGDTQGIRFPVLPLPFFNPIPGTPATGGAKP